MGVLQCNLAALLCDNARPVLVANDSPLMVSEILRAEASLTVIRRQLPEEATESLRKARQAVAGTSYYYLQELKRIPKPAVHIHDVLSAIVLLCGDRDCRWESIRRRIHQDSFKEGLVHLEPCHVSFANQQAVQAMVAHSPWSFDRNLASRTSSGLPPFLDLVMAFINCWQS